MIDFPAERVTRVRAFLELRTRHEGDGFEPIHRTLSQSYKAGNAKVRVAEYIGVIAFLFTGTPEDFDALSIDRALAVAERIFARDPSKTAGKPSGGLLFDHAKAILTAEHVKTDGYVDVEAHHLTFLGGELLFRRVVEALVQPYVEEPRDRARTYAEATVTDVPLFLRPEPLRSTLKLCRHWPEWETALRMAEMHERRLSAVKKEEDRSQRKASQPRSGPPSRMRGR